ncbi:hypothetical protein [Aliarcobacter butzleri]|uniref:hypothetical protein n=1 Tax=Aliarcobacter butzleri TaxID=28197 RepID=UPI0021B3913C|nr:hypothetical protein [Aliarcobacter butzleri]MCT7596101.1 hypothetical protein [Aliarcobacter butzleri]
MFAKKEEFNEALKIEKLMPKTKIYQDLVQKIMEEDKLDIFTISNLLQSFKNSKVFVYQKFKVIKSDLAIGLANDFYILFLKNEDLNLLQHTVKEGEDTYLSGFFTKDFIKSHFVGSFFCSTRTFKKL